MYELIRTEVVTAVNADYVAEYPTVPLIYDNQPFDRNNPPELFLELEIKFYSGNQISMSADPKTRVRGFIYVTAFCKEGTGTGRALKTLDWMAEKLGYAILGITNVEAPQPCGSSNPKGWHTEGMKFAFWADKP